MSMGSSWRARVGKMEKVKMRRGAPPARPLGHSGAPEGSMVNRCMARVGHLEISWKLNQRYPVEEDGELFFAARP